MNPTIADSKRGAGQMNESNSLLRMAIFCSSGYVFEEVYKPIIERLNSRCSIRLLVTDYYLGSHAKELIQDLFMRKKISSFKIVHIHEQKGSAWEYHRTMRLLAEELTREQLDILLLGSDFQLFEKYLLRAVLGQDTLVALIQTGTLIRVLEEFRLKNHLKTYERPYQSFPARINGLNILSALFTFLKAIKRSLTVRIVNPARNAFRRILHDFIIPFFQAGFVFPVNPFEKFAFCSGKTHVVMCYSPIEQEAIRTVVPIEKDVRVVAHPSSGYACRCHESRNSDRQKKMLVAFGGCLHEEMKENRIDIWCKAIAKSARLSGACEIHFRTHPRTSGRLHWPKKIFDVIAKMGYDVSVINALDFSFIEHVCDYSVLLTSPSGAMRVARNVCRNISILGLSNCCDGGPDDQSWIVGDTDGIHWIESENDINPNQFQRLEILNKPFESAAEIIIQLHNHFKKTQRKEKV